MSKEKDETVGEPPALDPLPPTEGGIERELFGKWTVWLRNIGGLIAVIVVCAMGVFNSYTIYISVKDHQVWPSETSMFIMVVGPVVASWTWMQSSKTIQAILTGVDNLTSVRSKLAKVIAPKPETPRSDAP